MVIMISFIFAIHRLYYSSFLVTHTSALKNRTFGTFSLRKYLLNRRFVFMTETAHETENIQIKIFLRRTLQKACAGWKNTHPASVRSALELLRAVFSPHCSSLSTRTTANLKTPLSSSRSLQMTPHLSASSRTVMSLLTDRRSRSWLSGAVLTTWSWTHSKQWK